MEMNKTPWPITTTFCYKEKIDTNPDYQRPCIGGTYASRRNLHIHEYQRQQECQQQLAYSQAH